MDQKKIAVQYNKKARLQKIMYQFDIGGYIF